MYDIERGTLTIANDRYGMKPIYYYHRRPLLTFASTVSAILEDDRVKERDQLGRMARILLLSVPAWNQDLLQEYSQSTERHDFDGYE